MSACEVINILACSNPQELRIHSRLLLIEYLPRKDSDIQYALKDGIDWYRDRHTN